MKYFFLRGGACLLVLALTGCSHIASLFGLSGTYSFTGASIPDAATTFSVAYIPNNTAHFATLSNALTEALKDRFSRQTKLIQVSENGDLAFEGEITSITEAPSAIGAASGGQTERATANRVTITVTMMFTNAVEPTLSFENRQTFTAYTDFDATQMLSSVENQLLDELVTDLVDKIFTASVAQW